MMVGPGLGILVEHDGEIVLECAVSGLDLWIRSGSTTENHSSLYPVKKRFKWNREKEENGGNKAGYTGTQSMCG